MSKLIKTDNEYKEWIGELKQRIRQSQIKAAVKVNTELLKLYWSIGGDIVRLKAEAKWGDGIIEQLSQDEFSRYEWLFFAQPLVYEEMVFFLFSA